MGGSHWFRLTKCEAITLEYSCKTYNMKERQSMHSSQQEPIGYLVQAIMHTQLTFVKF